MHLLASSELDRRGLRQLVLLFLLWKALIVIAVYGSPGNGYDTSTRILFDQYRSRPQTGVESLIERVVLRLTRWDGIYFATLSERGHINEQDWAFSWLLTRSVDWLSNRSRWSLTSSSIVDRALVCILVSHISHLLAVVALYRLALELVPRSDPSRSRIAFTAAALHVVSPAGIFLCAPSGESAFAWFNFIGTLSYVYAVKLKSATQPSLPRQAALTVTAGLAFAIATMIRGNGLLSGILFAFDALQDILQPRRLFSSSAALGRLAATGLAGVLVGIGYATPQVIAYLEYCTGRHTRPWCQRMPPSVFSWVQSHYWDVGFLRYWTLGNAPLFLLAAPMIAILCATGIAALQGFDRVWELDRTVDAGVHGHNKIERQQTTHSLQRLAVPQLVLAWLTATTFHVQIINRISSGYPLWYVVLAIWLHANSRISREKKAMTSRVRDPTRGRGLTQSPKLSKEPTLQRIVRTMIVYAIVQGGLYACFLPPA